MRSLISELIDDANVFLVLLSYLLHIPAEYTSIPKSSSCRIFSAALHQRECGSCAAFAVSTLSAMKACIQENEDFIPSPFRVFDCTNATCDTGVTITRAASIVEFGVGDIDASPRHYGLRCDLQWGQHRPTRLHITGHVISRKQQIKAAILFTGPVAGSMTRPIWRDWKSGVYHSLPADHPFASSVSKTLHAVVVVGWDSDDNWIIQNSWGREWGDEHGRGRVAADLLVDVNDPTIHIMKRFLTCCVLACMGGLLILAAVDLCAKRNHGSNAQPSAIQSP
jgi:hypothetical protein